MAPRTRPSPEIVEDVVVCAPLIVPTSTATARPPREIPCIGCLILLVNWIPEDGKPFPCSDPEIARKDGKCLRCVRRSKLCEKPCLGDAIKNARELASLLSEHPPNLASIKRVQEEIKKVLEYTLSSEADMHAFWNNDLDDQANQLLSALRANIDTARWVIRTANDVKEGPLIRRAIHVVDSVSSMADALMESTPPQFAHTAAEEIGLF